MFIVDPYSPSITYNDVTVKLTPMEMKVFVFLYKNRDKKVAKVAIMDHLYSLETDAEPDMKILDVFICKIRKKIKATGIVITTVWSFGWKLEMPKAETATFVGAVLA